jgi:hypothetical protein
MLFYEGFLDINIRVDIALLPRHSNASWRWGVGKSADGEVDKQPRTMNEALVSILTMSY